MAYFLISFELHKVNETPVLHRVISDCKRKPYSIENNETKIISSDRKENTELFKFAA
jgi:hypothetical protein